MRRYQLMTIIDPAVGEKSVADVQRSVETLIEQRGGHIEQGARHERADLATPIDGVSEGFRGFSIVTLPQDQVHGVQNALRHQQSLLRSMVVAIEKEERMRRKASSSRSTRKTARTSEEVSSSFSDKEIAREINAVIEREVEKVSKAEEKAQASDESDSQEAQISEEELKDIDDQLDKMLEGEE